MLVKNLMEQQVLIVLFMMHLTVNWYLEIEVPVIKKAPRGTFFGFKNKFFNSFILAQICPKKRQLTYKTKSQFNYEILDKYTAGIVLTGTEIKSIRTSKASIAESFVNLMIEDIYY